MAKYYVTGGKSMSGEINISGAKNAVLPILSAAILNGSISVIHNCPRIADVEASLEILESLGAEIKRDKNTVIIDSSSINKTSIEKKLMEKMRSSVIFSGSLLARFGSAEFFSPGGCKLGKRPIDLHLSSMEMLGANIFAEGEKIRCTCDKINGNTITLPIASVGATENIILSSVFCEGTTVIRNAAKEPEICDLQSFINSMGGKVNGSGTYEITIEGVKKLGSTEYTVMPDRIETGTFLCMAAMTKGDVILKNTDYMHCLSLLDILCCLDFDIKYDKSTISLKSKKRPHGRLKVSTDFYPGFPTDLQPQLTALLTISDGTSIITERIFEARDKHIDELIKMGANIKNEKGCRFTIKGIERLTPSDVCAKDLRGGAALVCAGACAEGRSEISGAEYIFRGYENFDEKLRGAGIEIFSDTKR